MAEKDNALFYLGVAGAEGYRRARVRLVDELFRHVAEQVVKERGGELSVDEVTEWTWQMFELGQIRLVIGKGDKPSLGYEHCNSDEGQREVAKLNRRLVARAGECNAGNQPQPSRRINACCSGRARN